MSILFNGTLGKDHADITIMLFLFHLINDDVSLMQFLVISCFLSGDDTHLVLCLDATAPFISIRHLRNISLFNVQAKQ